MNLPSFQSQSDAAVPNTPGAARRRLLEKLKAAGRALGGLQSGRARAVRAWRGWRPRPGFAGGKSGLCERAGRLAETEQALREFTTAVEQAFLATGAALGEQTRLTAELVANGQRFRSFSASTAEANPVREAIALVEHALRALDEFQAAGGSMIERLRGQHEEIGRLRQNGAQLERAIAPLRIVETLFRIEAATLPADMQAAFGALTQEISQLHARVRDTFSHHFEALGVTAETLGVVVDQLVTQRAEHDRVVVAQRLAIRESLASLEAEMIRLRRRDTRASELIEAIDRQTNGIVVGLQYQDITRQKLEHVVAAVAGLPERLETGASERATAVAHHAARLQGTQLVAIESDLDRASDGIGAGLREVVARLEQVEAECLDRADLAEAAAGVAATVDSLLGMLTHVRESLDGMAAQAGSASAAVQSCGGITANLGGTVRELTWGIRLIALNAQVQAAQVARCDGLEVLARHTYLVSDETSAIAERLGNDLGVFTTRLRESVDEVGRFAEQTRRTQEELTAALPRIESRLQQQRAEVLAALEEFPGLVRRTREHASQLLAHADVTRIDRAPVRALREQLESLAAWCGERLPPAGPDAALKAEFAALEAHYTMESERAVHEAVLSGGTVGERAVGSGMARPAAVAAEAATPETAALGDNVELF